MDRRTYEWRFSKNRTLGKEVEKIDPDINQVMLDRAKEMLSHTRWRAEKEFPAQ